MKMIYEGKAKRLYETEVADELLMEYKDDVTAGNGAKHAQFEDKGKLNKKLSMLIYSLLEEGGIPTHHIREVDETHVLVRRVDIIPLEVVVRNAIAGSLSKRTGIEEGVPLDEPIIETFYKKDELNDPIITDAHVLKVLKLCSKGDLAVIKEMVAFKVNALLGAAFEKAGIRLIDFKMEFGKTADGDIILADEISPDCCRLWDAASGEKLDKDRFRRDLGDLTEGYQQVLERLQNAL